MALTEVVRLRLEGKGFDALYSEHEQEWTESAESARKLIAEAIATGSEPTVDDIKKPLLPLVEINPELRSFLARKNLTQKYWVDNFTDYILHRVYKPKLTIAKE